MFTHPTGCPRSAARSRGCAGTRPGGFWACPAKRPVRWQAPPPERGRRCEKTKAVMASERHSIRYGSTRSDLAAGIGLGNNVAASVLESSFVRPWGSMRCRRADILESSNEIYRTSTMTGILRPGRGRSGWSVGLRRERPPFRLAHWISLWDRQHHDSRQGHQGVSPAHRRLYALPADAIVSLMLTRGCWRRNGPS